MGWVFNWTNKGCKCWHYRERAATPQTRRTEVARVGSWCWRRHWLLLASLALPGTRCWMVLPALHLNQGELTSRQPQICVQQHKKYDDVHVLVRIAAIGQEIRNTAAWAFEPALQAPMSSTIRVAGRSMRRSLIDRAKPAMDVHMLNAAFKRREAESTLISARCLRRACPVVAIACLDGWMLRAVLL